MSRFGRCAVASGRLRISDDGTVATRLLLISDTHVPARARRVPDDVWRAIDDADLVVHAGDWVDVATLDAIEARAGRLIGVAGNNDGAELHARLGEFARFEVGGLRFGVVHETGPAPGREARMDAAYAHDGLERSTCSTCSCSATATSRGTRRRPGASGC